MAYPIFDETMVDLTWQEVERAGKENQTIILPISVIEEHGPHLDLAPDVYLTHLLSKNCRRELKKIGIPTLIAPHFYWGINRCTGSFPGSFTVREETMIMMISDIVSSLKKWGFNNIYVLNVHGDYFHIITILKAIDLIRAEQSANIQYVMDTDMVETYGIDEKKDNVLIYKCEGTEEELSEYSYSEYADIHAGGAETSCMLKDFPNSVKKDLIPTLKDSKLPWDKLDGWCDENARELTPLGYCGNPAHINTDEIKKWDVIVAKTIATNIKKHLDL